MLCVNSRSNRLGGERITTNLDPHIFGEFIFNNSPKKCIEGSLCYNELIFMKQVHHSNAWKIKFILHHNQLIFSTDILWCRTVHAFFTSPEKRIIT